ncbi:MAG TPA: hypothetical protein VIM12_05875 [Noviherbaspirillum sp.]|jgi:uncharacterized phiE125 gp8 family phage protein|uniref:head-tail connector protein n=1 Tax=Noviherbaspirillum sp. TaxID=1926288 RepID=UPI002F9584C9
MHVRVITPPAAELISLPRARLQCKIDADIAPVAPATEPTSSRDAEIADAIKTARESVQSYLQRAIGEQTLELVMTGWDRCVSLPMGEVKSVVSIKYDADDGEQTLNPSDYSLHGGERAFVQLSATPALKATPENVRIRYVAGYSESSLPGPVKSAMLLLISDLVENASRQTERALSENTAFCRLLEPLRLGMGV